MKNGLSICVAIMVLAGCGGHTSKDAGTDDSDVDAGQPPGNPCSVPEPTTQAGPDTGMLLVPEGPFWRGCNPAVDTGCQMDESPGACVTLAAYEIDLTEVSQINYQQCIMASACTAPGCGFTPMTTQDLPVTCVTWDQANTYCAWVDSGMKRLPTEAEWEKADRGTDGRLYPWGSEAPSCTLSDFGGCGGMPKAVGTNAGDVTPYSVDDMAGNVSEWVADWYSAGYYSSAPAQAPTGPGAGTNRVQRGGSFSSPVTSLRASARFNDVPSDATAEVGFRCAKSMP